MQTILTLSVGEFELVHDILSLLIAGMGASALFFLLSRKQISEHLQPLMLIAGIVAAIGCYHSMRLFNSWNEAFELAGNSYAASGHFFHALYRYSDWALTMPLLLVELVLVLELPEKKAHSLLTRLIVASLATVFFSYLGVSSFGEHGITICWSYWLLALIPFLYLSSILIRELSVEEIKKELTEEKTFFKARNLFLLSWAFYPAAVFIRLCCHGFSERGFVAFLVGASIADFFLKCGVSFYVYRIALVKNRNAN